MPALKAYANPANFCGPLCDLGLGVKLRLMTVTPELCEEWGRKVHPRNRKETPSKVAQYAADMEEGNFSLSDQAMSFDEDGLMVNGNNRRLACIKAEKPFLSLVLHGLPRDSFPNLDGSKKRTTDDNAKIAGIEIPRGAGGTVRRMIMGFATWAGRAITDQEVFAFLAKHKKHVVLAHTVLPKGMVANSSVRAVVARASACNRPVSRLEEFGKVLMTGFMIPGDEAAIQLRNHILEGERLATKARVNLYGMTQTALLYFLDGERTKKVVIGKKENFPLAEDAE